MSMGDSTEVSEGELEWMEDNVPSARHLVAALRSTRERLAAAEAVCELYWADRGLMYNQRGMTSPHRKALDAWRALAHPTTEEPTE